MPLIILLCFL